MAGRRLCGWNCSRLSDVCFAMAVYFKGMTTREISDLTMNMVKTGQEFDLSAIEGLRLASILLVV